MHKLTQLTIFLIFITQVISINEKEIHSLQCEIEALQNLSKTYQHKEENFNPQNDQPIEDDEEYDFIVIGAGASGGVIASRLAEENKWKILLLEAGTYETNATQIPAMSATVLNTPYNWKYNLEPSNTSCLGMIDNQCALDAGKGVGGGTVINVMMVTHGSRKDWDGIEKLGFSGWSYENILPYLKKFEDTHIVDEENGYHGHDGPIHVENILYSRLNRSAILAAHKSISSKKIDYNGKTDLGIGHNQQSTKGGQRVSTGKAYVQPTTETKPNFKLKTGSHVTKIIINPKTKRAESVQYLLNGKQLVNSKAKKEIILSAGAINTPQILMLSGVGPKEELKKFNIPVIADLKVGHNLKNQMTFAGLAFYYNNHSTQPSQSLHDKVKEYLSHEGPLTLSGPELVAFTKSNQSNPQDKPDLELVYVGGAHSNGFENVGFLRLREKVYNGFYKPNEGRSGFVVNVIHLHPKSTGSVKLKDVDPLHHPLIEMNPFSDPDDHDIKTMLSGVKYVLKIAASDPIEKLGVTLNRNRMPGCEKFEDGSDDYWTCCLRFISTPTRHPMGTARMGLVVDHTLKVFGVSGLRVVDNSVLPVTITGHPMAPAIAIGEKAADLVKADWKF